MFKIINHVHVTKSVSVTVDCPKMGGRYQVTLVHDTMRDVYIVSAPNYYVSIERDSLEAVKHCSYKLQEKGILDGDADTIQQIVAEILIPALLEECRA